jgi:uncharacterized membrane protein
VDYLVVKWLHIVSSTIVFGTGIGSAYYFFCAGRRRDPAIVAFVGGALVVADWLFTATTMVLQPLTGAYMVHTMGFAWSATWLWLSLVLFAAAAACWIPVVVLQIRMRNLARAALAGGVALGDDFGRLFRWWVALGFPALLAFLAIFYLMTAKPL